MLGEGDGQALDGQAPGQLELVDLQGLEPPGQGVGSSLVGSGPRLGLFGGGPDVAIRLDGLLLSPQGGQTLAGSGELGPLRVVLSPRGGPFLAGPAAASSATVVAASSFADPSTCRASTAASTPLASSAI